jgi:hypothetical protein
MVASYLARARGSNEPELSISRTKDLEQFVRECSAFQLDFGHLYAAEKSPDPAAPLPTARELELSRQVDAFRDRFEELLGNANG